MNSTVYQSGGGRLNGHQFISNSMLDEWGIYSRINSVGGEITSAF